MHTTGTLKDDLRLPIFTHHYRYQITICDRDKIKISIHKFAEVLNLNNIFDITDAFLDLK